MPKRKIWNPGTALRYEQKAYKIAGAQGAPPEVTMRVVLAQTGEFTRGAGRYKEVRDMARRVMTRPDTKVNPVFRAPYFAFAQRLFKLCVVTKETTPDVVIEEFMRKSDMYNDAILAAIVEELGLGTSEVVGRAAGS